MDTNLIGKCGLYCGACTIYRAERDNPDLRKKIADHYKCSEDQVCCQGCGGLTDACWGNGCKIVLCVNAKGIKSCYECENYHNSDCEKFMSMYQSYLTEGVDLRSNLNRINAGEAETWLSDSSAYFRCPFCGHPLHVGAKICPSCAKNIVNK